MSVKRACRALFGIPFLCAALLLTAACSDPNKDLPTYSSVELDPNLQAMALMEVRTLQARGQRVWCVPFARNASGIQIRGNANTWWGKADGVYEKGNAPAVGAVMSWKATSRLPRGHIAVVSEVVSPREIRVDHANWTRNKVSLKMAAIDVSAANDWSAVKLESQPNAFGSVYAINGFIYPN